MADLPKGISVTPMTQGELADLLKEWQGVSEGWMAAKAQDILEKTLTTANVPFRQNLSDLVTFAVQRRTPLRDRFRRVPAGGGAQVEWYAITALTANSGFFTEGNAPNPAEPNYGINPPAGYETYSIPPRRAIFKPIAFRLEVTAQAQLISANFHHQLASAIEYAAVNVLQAEEKALIFGDSTQAGQFDGLKKWITTNTNDKAGAPLTWNDILEACQSIWLKGGTPKTIVVGPREARILSTQYLNALRPIEPGVVAPWGVSVKRVMTDFGELEVVVSQYLVPETRGTLQNVTDVFVLDEDHPTMGGGLLPGQAIEVHELLPLQVWVFPMQSTLVTPVVVWEMVTLVVRAQEWQAVILNVGAP